MFTLALSAAVLLADHDDPYRDKKRAWLLARTSTVRKDANAVATVREQYAAQIAAAEAKKKAAEAEVTRLKGMKVPTNFGSFKKYGDALDTATADLTRLQEDRRKAEAVAEVRKVPGVIAPAGLTVGFFGKINPKDEPVNGAFQVAQVIDANTAVVEWADETVCVQHKAKTFVAGQSYTHAGWVDCLGTKPILTRLGAAKTVFAVKLVD